MAKRLSRTTVQAPTPRWGGRSNDLESPKPHSGHKNHPASTPPSPSQPLPPPSLSASRHPTTTSMSCTHHNGKFWPPVAHPKSTYTGPDDTLKAGKSIQGVIHRNIRRSYRSPETRRANIRNSKHESPIQTSRHGTLRRKRREQAARVQSVRRLPRLLTYVIRRKTNSSHPQRNAQPAGLGGGEAACQGGSVAVFGGAE